MTLPKAIFQVGHLERVPLGTPYPGIVAHVGRLLGKLPAGTELVIDYTGVGRPIFDMFAYAGISPLGVLITAGIAETWEGAICSVPKLTLVSRLQALLHEGRLKILKELAEAETLVRELQEFRVEFTAAGHLTFNARSGKHDDLVLAHVIALVDADPLHLPDDLRGDLNLVRRHDVTRRVQHHTFWRYGRIHRFHPLDFDLRRQVQPRRQHAVRARYEEQQDAHDNPSSRPLRGLRRTPATIDF